MAAVGVDSQAPRVVPGRQALLRRRHLRGGVPGRQRPRAILPNIRHATSVRAQNPTQFAAVDARAADATRPARHPLGLSLRTLKFLNPVAVAVATPSAKAITAPGFRTEAPIVTTSGGGAKRQRASHRIAAPILSSILRCQCRKR